MSTYDRLVRQKRHGEQPDIKQLSYDLLYQLWWEDDCSDGEIANAFDVTKKKITNLRFKWGLKVPETIVAKIEQQSDGSIPTLEEDQRVSAVSKEAALLLRKLNGLNDIELESVRLALARRFAAFAEIKQESEFLDAVERVIRQFGSRE